MHKLNRSLHLSCAIFLLDRYYNFTVRNALLGEHFALYKFNSRVTCLLLVRSSSVLVLYTPIIKYIFRNIFSLISTLGGKNGKNTIGLNPLHTSTVVIAQLLRTLLDNLLVKGLILLRFFVLAK